ncbi:hypothetical protein BKA58DRAFT_459155 [Alternaria rosae]|uniref:uncharacterized protein n=1 Tax=Alternaria rosae TaxID=1187941 RepID=UPI001E8E00A2|nr:uncharacterized protein BKA58DRAFT_459155 [Alternaria rosae]KAH6868396.1 hypothetical protein BKA58DRAFT_459155 [Alternaria rosae]
MSSNHVAAYSTPIAGDRRRNHNRAILRNMPPKNTSYPGYSSEHSPDKPDQDVLSDFEKSSSSSSESPPKEKRVTTSESEDDDVVAVNKDSTPSPTASDILPQFELADIQEANNLNKKWMGNMSDAERAKKLKELLEKRKTDKATKEREVVEETMRRVEEDEEQSEGKVQDDDNPSLRLSYHFVFCINLSPKIRIQNLIRRIRQLFTNLTMVVREGPEQAQRRATANGMSKKWKIPRRNKRSRGLVNTQNSCYRHGALQPLLHLPRFVNWIKTHNVLNHWRCLANDPNCQLPTDPLTLRAIEREIAKAKTKNFQDYKEDEAYRGCVPCLLKKLMTAYWNNTLIGGAPNLVPQPLPHYHPAILSLHQLIERWFCVDPPNHTHTGNQATIAARRRHMRAQQDADEFTGYIFDGIASSYDRLTEHGAARGAEFDSLFGVRKRVVHTCDHCHNSTIGKIENEPRGLRIIPSNSINIDTVDNAIARSLTDTRKGRCDTCDNQDSDLTETNSIVAAPEYLRIYLQLAQSTKRYVVSKDGKTVPIATLTKNPRHIIIPDILDLTQQMDYITIIQNPDTVRYKLVSATYHREAQLSAGHYTAAVTGPALPGQWIRPQFFCDGTHITDLSPTAAHPNAITENPMQGGFDAVTLYYERIAPTGRTSGRANKLSKADQEVVEEGKARRENLDSRRKGKEEGEGDEKSGDEKKGNGSKKRKSDEMGDEQVKVKNTKKKGGRKGKEKASDVQGQEQGPKKWAKTPRSVDQSSWDALQQAYDLSKTPGPLDQSIWTAFGQLNDLSKTLKSLDESS